MVDGYTRLVKKIKEYYPSCDFELLNKAYILAKTAHEGQMRVSGEPFIVHPVEVGNILAELELDCTSITAAILHDVVEDTAYTNGQLRKEFGDEVANLVDGVTKLEKIYFNSKEERQAENLRKMFLAMAKDIRVILIKLADRLHNMRTLKAQPPRKQINKAKETMEIYAPLAHRLGIFKLKSELEDLCLRYLDPQGYYDLVDSISHKKRERDAYINRIMDDIKAKTKGIGIDAHIDGRAKHFYSIYRKMKEQNKTLEEIYDLFALRVIVNSVNDCYAVLGLIHELYKPIPFRFKDYIAMPKPNMYQSLHTTLIGKEGIPFEVQIRTWDMHRVAEVGIAAHWKYKEGSAGESDIDNKLVWLRQLLEWQKEMRDANEFMETLKIDLFTDEVFVFTPRGDVINLPVGSTPIDFAYAIHSAIGNKMMGAKINGKIVPLGYELKNGDIVDILTSGSVRGPSRDWLKIIKSSQARNKINQWFKKQNKEENIVKGKEIVDRELKKLGISYNDLFKPDWVDIVLKRYNYNTLNDILASIGYGGITANKVISRLKEEYKKHINPDEMVEQIPEWASKKKTKHKNHSVPESGIIVKGIENCLVRLSRCCNPVPGDDIVGYITRGRGVSVHRKDCTNIINNMDDDRIIEVSWYTATNIAYKADITVLASDRTALLMEVTNVIGESKIPLKGINARTTREQVAVIHLTVEITDTEQLDEIIKKLKKVADVFEVTRSNQ